MAKKKKSVESVLADAEKFFQRGNFQLAHREFKKVQKKLQRDDIAEKIEVCERENRAARAKELIKKGHKAVGKNDIEGALGHFRDALTLDKTSETWLREKIENLENEHFATCADTDASRAEAEGDFAGAAQLYAVAAEKTDDVTPLLKSASCLVRAGDYSGALDCFSKSGSREEPLRKHGEQFVYDFGFALAKTGSFTGALKVWQNLPDTNEEFLQQKRDLFAIALSELCKKHGNADNLSEQKADLDPDQITAQARELHTLSGDLGTDSQILLLENIVKYFKYDLMERAWARGEYSAVSDLLGDLERSNDHGNISLKARTAFHLSKDNPSSLKTMVSYWLTCIYSMETARAFSSDPVQRARIQQKLISMAESITSAHIDTPEGRFASKSIKLEKRLIADLLTMARKSGLEEDEYAGLICTPRYASLCGLAPDILKWFAMNRSFFDDSAHYWETGGYYCKAWESLYLMKTGEIDKAVEHLDSLPQESFIDEFSQYVRRIVNFEYGKSAIVSGKKDFLKYFDETHLLFESDSALENRFVEFLNEYHEVGVLQKYEQVVAKLYAINPSDNMAKTLSFTMIQSAIARDNSVRIHPRAMKLVACKALKLDPENEYANEVLGAIEVKEELEEMMTAMSRRKFAKASKIVNASSHPEVETYYFDSIDNHVSHFENDYDDPEFVLVLIREMYDWAKTVDAYHPVIERMEALLARRS